MMISKEADSHAHGDREGNHAPGRQRNWRFELIGHFALTEQSVPEHVWQGVVGDHRTQYAAQQRRNDSIGEIMPPDLRSGEAQRLERAHLHTLIVNHA